MNILPSYTITYELLELVSKIDALRQLFSSFQIPEPVQDKIQRMSLLKSSLFSARIEGNPIRLDEIETTTEEQKKKEIYNIISANRFIEKTVKKSQPITIQLVKDLHRTVMQDITADAGKLRREMGAIFNESGMVVYLSPPPEKIKSLINRLLIYINNAEERIPLVSGLISHLAFEKIHPFIDGNGRVGRLLINAVLRSKGYDFNILIPFEEYIYEHKNEYYRVIENGLKDPQSYLLFMLKAFYEEAELVKKVLFQELQKKETILLPPRQEEIFNVIKDHRIVSFDFLRRRFLNIPPRTLRYDLKKIVDAKLVVKTGKTKGSWYSVK